MFELPRNAVVPLEKFVAYYNEDPKVYVDLSLVEAEVASLRAKYLSRLQQLKDMMYSTLGWIPNELTRQVIFKYLDNRGVPERYTLARATKKETFNKSAKKKMIEDGYCVDFNLIHKDMSSLKCYLDRIKKLLSSVRNNKKVEGNYGEELTEIPYSITATFNRRFSTANQNIIGFYGTLRAAMRAPKGHVLVGADFPQIDGKGALNLYFKTKLMLDIHETTSDSYLVFKELERHVAHKREQYELQKALQSKEFVDTSEMEKRISKFSPVVLPFASKSHRDTYKVISLMTVYNSRSSPFREPNAAIKRLAGMVDVTGRYRIVKEYAMLFKEIGYPIMARSRWGYTRPITESNTFSILAQLFNCPIQTTSSEILIMFSVHILDYFRGLGYGPDQIKLYVNRHDEPIFDVDENVYRRHVGFFKQMSHILVHGWLPFEIEWNVGYEYKASHNEFTDMLDMEMYDDSIIHAEAKKYLSIPEPITLEIPELFALTYRALPNGKVIFLWTRHFGEFPEDEYYFDIWKDSRPVEYSMMSAALAAEQITFDDIMFIISKMIAGLDSKKQYIVMLDSDYGSRQFTLAGYSVFVTGYKNPLHELNKVIIGSVMCQNFPQVATDEDRRYNKYAKYYSSRLIKRVIS